MIELNFEEAKVISGGLDVIQIYHSTKLGMQIGAPLGAAGGAFLGFCNGAIANSVGLIVVLMPVYGLVGFFAGACALGAGFAVAATVYNVTKDFTNAIYC